MSDVAEDVLTSAEAGGRVIRASAMRVGGNAAGIVVGIVATILTFRFFRSGVPGTPKEPANAADPAD